MTSWLSCISHRGPITTCGVYPCAPMMKWCGWIKNRTRQQVLERQVCDESCFFVQRNELSVPCYCIFFLNLNKICIYIWPCICYGTAWLGVLSCGIVGEERGNLDSAHVFLCDCKCCSISKCCRIWIIPYMTVLYRCLYSANNSIRMEEERWHSMLIKTTLNQSWEWEK